VGAVIGAVVGFVVATLCPSPIAIEQSRPWPDSTLRSKKDAADGAADVTGEIPKASLLTTYGVVVSLRENEILVMSDTEPSAENFSWLLRDRVTWDSVEMAPALLGLLRKLAEQQAQGEVSRVEIVSGYRSWKLNEMLRKKGRNVASQSQHVLGNAMDFRVDGMSSQDLAAVVEGFEWRGGLAFYPGDTDRFVHADVGANRRWRGR